MNHKRLKWGLYDTNVGDHDEYNPRYVYSKDKVPEISYLIAANTPYTLTNDDIAEMLQVEKEICTSAIDAMLRINAISVHDRKYKINFPVFLEKDMDMLSDFCLNIAEILAEKIISLKDEIDPKLAGLAHFSEIPIQRLRYHIIGSNTLDGGVFDYFEKEKLLTTSKLQPGERDYLVIGHEDSEKVHELSNKILCSNNIFYSGNIGFGSFGDSDGMRKDMMRFFRRLQASLARTTEHEGLNLAYIKLVDDYNRIIAQKCADLALKSLVEDVSFKGLCEEDGKLAEFLRELGYIKYENLTSKIVCCVPVFEPQDMKIINEVSDIIVNNIFDTVKQTINTLDKTVPDLTSVKHGVSFPDIANELWHLIFGPINEYLVKAGFFEEPQYIPGEGRYFQALYIYE